MKPQIVLNLSFEQKEWVAEQAKNWADLNGHSVSEETVLLKLMELGLPLFMTEMRQKQAIAAAKGSRKAKRTEPKRAFRIIKGDQE